MNNTRPSGDWLDLHDIIKSPFSRCLWACKLEKKNCLSQIRAHLPESELLHSRETCTPQLGAFRSPVTWNCTLLIKALSGTCRKTFWHENAWCYPICANYYDIAQHWKIVISILQEKRLTVRLREGFLPGWVPSKHATWIPLTSLELVGLRPGT